MWLYTETGFISAVTHWENPSIVVVRSRDYQSLLPVADFADEVIQQTPNNDYPIRVEVKREVFAEWVAEQVTTMEYTNYKSRMYETRGPKFAHTLGDVWSTMHQIETARYEEQENESLSAFSFHSNT
jgi:hypothetical protein